MTRPVTFDVADRSGRYVETDIDGDRLNELLTGPDAGRYVAAVHADHDCKRDGCNGQTGGA